MKNTVFWDVTPCSLIQIDAAGSSKTFLKMEELSLPGRLNCVRWRLIFVGPQDGTCFMSLVWRLQY